MNILIFSDLDGTFMNHDDYSYHHLKQFITKIKNKSEIIFTSSKTFAEITKIKKKINLNFPFIVENGACIFYPKDYLDFNKISQKLIEYKNFVGLPISRQNITKIKDQIKKENLTSNFKFSFFSELSNQDLVKFTNLSIEDLLNSKKRHFSDPIYWNDSTKKLQIFKKKLTEKKIVTSEGGRFLHFNFNYDKGKAVNKFIKIYKKYKSKNFFTISLGDSENDLSMLELTNYSCVIKSSKKKKLYLKKSINNYYSEMEAPIGWKESLEYIFKKENLNF